MEELPGTGSSWFGRGKRSSIANLAILTFSSSSSIMETYSTLFCPMLDVKLGSKNSSSGAFASMPTCCSSSSILALKIAIFSL